MFRSIFIALSAFIVMTAHAQVTPLADAPLSTGGISRVRPNIMLLLDESSSLVYQYLPDSVKTAALCDTAASSYSGTTSTARLSSVAGACPQFNGNAMSSGLNEPAMQPRPPSYSPDVNLQYYNPEVSYLPPVNANLTSYPSMTGASTARGGVSGATILTPNWQAIPQDGYGAQTKFTFNIESWPISYYCDQQSPAVCAADTTYNYPERAASTTDLTAKRTPVAGALGAPHYYRLGISTYCQDEQLVNCTASTTPTGTYIYPARLRFCKDIDKSVCQKNYDAAPTRGYIVPSYIYVPVNGTTSSTYSTGTLTVVSLNNPNSRGNIATLSINGINVGPISLNAASTTALATSIAAQLNTIPNYTATASGTTVQIRSNTLGPISNGNPVAIDAPIVALTPASYTVTLTNANNNTLPAQSTLNTLTINGINIASAPIANGPGPSPGAFTTTAVQNWATNNGTNGYTAVVSTSGNSLILKLSKTNLSAYTLSDDNPTASASVTASSTKVVLSAVIAITKGVSTSATFSYNSGIVATNASGVLSGGAYDTSKATRGLWSRVSIVPGTLLNPATYPRGVDRIDCANNYCTYNEEMTNFANWFAYYRFRLNTIKTVTGQAFARLDSNYRVGYHTINGTPPSMLLVAPFDLNDTSSASQRIQWYNRLYTQTATNNTTPSRAGLGDVGRYYGGVTNVTDPIEYSCQKNYTIFVTDGYWNGTAGKDLGGSFITSSMDSDPTNPRSTRASGVFDGNNAGGTLADVAQYYYNIDLRSNLKNNVPTNSQDDNNAQHMNTYTLGLGVDGLMTYKKDYKTSTTGDFAKITSGATGCSWESSMSNVCNWPAPISGDITTVDDLWHAAVNGRGEYFSARTPKDAAEGLASAVSAVVAMTGAAAASATSSPNITQSDNFIYSSTYETAVWSGEVVAQRIDYTTGAVLPNIEWRASTAINAQADALSTNEAARTLLTIDTTKTTGDKQKPFNAASLTTVERTWFTGHCTSGQFGQCADGTVAFERKPFADDATNVVNYLRGHNDSNVFTANAIPFGYEQIFRDSRIDRLGDTVNAVPHYISTPPYTFNFTPASHETYQAFINRVSPTCSPLDTACLANPPLARPGVLYMAANDGMLHALDGKTGTERFGYVPRTTMPEMWRLADQNYATQHRYFVDGSPVSMDMSANDPTGPQVWKTILVGGYRSGGSGYYGMDVTDPTQPKVLWETCSNAMLCQNAIPDMGLSFGNPVLTRMPLSHPTLGGKWVALVSSGYNNVPSTITQPTAGAVSGLSTGKGFLFVLDPMSGALLKTYATNEGSITAPINLGKLSTFATNFYYDGISSLAFGGDLKGNVWRFDLSKEPTDTGAVYKLATLMKGTAIQPISTKIELGLLPGRPEPILFVGTGEYLNVGDLTDGSTQSLYAIRDAYSSIPAAATNNIYGNPRTYTPKPFVQQFITDVAGVRTITQNSVDWNIQSGWYTDFPDLGERVALDPTLVLGTLNVSTNVVNSTTVDACAVGGYSWLYQLNYATGGPLSTAPGGAVAYQVPGALIVGTVIIRLPSGVLKIITTTATGAKIPYGLNINSSTMSARRLSWRELSQ